MGLESIESTELESEWRAAANTYLGLTVSGYPNMFHMVSNFRLLLDPSADVKFPTTGMPLPALKSRARLQVCEYADSVLPPSFSWNFFGA
jgi:hypothetical protein